MSIEETPNNIDTREYELALLRPLAREFPNIDAAMAEIARLSAILTLPKGTVHVISDIHGEDKKLRHVINNASGTLRPLLEKLFSSKMDANEFQEFLTLVCFIRPKSRLNWKNLSPIRNRRVFTRCAPYAINLHWCARWLRATA